MEEEKIVTEVTENVEDTTEQVEGVEFTDTTEPEKVEEITEQVRTYTDEEVDSIIAKKIARERAKISKEYEAELSKYRNTESVLNAGLGTKSIDEATSKLREYYEEQGIKLPEPTKPGLSEREIEILAKAEAEEIIELGVEEMTKEANQLASKGYINLNSKEKVIFNTLAERLNAENKKSELIKNGIKADILEDKDFKAFADKFNAKTSMLDIYNLYTKTKPIEKPKPIGSMATTETNKVKDFYTMEEINKLTEKDYDDPQVMRAVELSLEKLYKDKA